MTPVTTMATTAMASGCRPAAKSAKPHTAPISIINTTTSPVTAGRPLAPLLLDDGHRTLERPPRAAALESEHRDHEERRDRPGRAGDPNGDLASEGNPIRQEPKDQADRGRYQSPAEDRPDPLQGGPDPSPTVVSSPRSERTAQAASATLKKTAMNVDTYAVAAAAM
jgi:hypothetical protein